MHPVASICVAAVPMDTVAEEWEEAQWKQKDKKRQRNGPMKIQDKEMGYREPHTSGQILTGLFVYYSSQGKGGGGLQPSAFSLHPEIEWLYDSNMLL